MTNDTAIAIRDFDLENTVPHCPVVLVLDMSHSMWGQGLTDMMESLKVFHKTMTNEQFTNAQVDIAAVSMGDNLCMLEDFTPLQDSTLHNRKIRPKGDTPIGAALVLAQKSLQEQIARYNSAGISYVTPNLILLSDGKSTDDFQAVAEEIHRAVSSHQLICRAIALGDSADKDALSQIAGRNNVLVPNNGGMRQAFAEVGQIVSQTYEVEAQEVIADEASTVECGSETEYLLDGSNIIHWDKNRSGVTLRYLLLITEYLTRNHQKFQVFFDATARHILGKNSPQEAQLYEKLLKKDPDHFFQVPAGTSADSFLLLQADLNRNAFILTQDQFRDHMDEHPWLKTEKRVVEGMVMNSVIYFPAISLQIPIPSTEKWHGEPL